MQASRWWITFVLMVGLPGTGFAMTTADFITRWQAATHSVAVKGGSPTAEEVAKKPEVSSLLREFTSAAQKYRTEVLDERAQGKTPRACPPKGVDITVDQTIADILKLPAAWRGRPLSESFAETMDRRYPCPPRGSS